MRVCVCMFVWTGDDHVKCASEYVCVYIYVCIYVCVWGGYVCVDRR